MKWTKPGILAKLRQLGRRKQSLSYSVLAKKQQSLLSAAVYHFGSYRDALKAAGIDYAEVLRRPRWTKPRIIALIKQAKRAGGDLNWSAVIQRGDELSRAAYAALQKRLFHRWDRALHAAGLDADEVSCYRTWDRNTVVFELRARAQDGEALSSGALQKEDPGLHAAAVRYFGSHDRALRAARLNPKALRQRKRWTEAEVIRSLKRLEKSGHSCSDTAVRREHAALYGAATRFYGVFTEARKKAGIAWKRDKSKRK